MKRRGNEQMTTKLFDLNVILTIANAVAAVASACAAIYALNVASSQVQVAKNQIEATYLSNLYTKQIDGIRSFETAVDNFIMSLKKDSLFDGAILVSADAMNEIQSVMKSHRQQYFDEYTQITNFSNVLKLVLPISLHKHLDYGRDASRTFLFRAIQFASTKASDASLKILYDEANRIDASTRKWHDQFFLCMHDVLQGGNAVTEATTKACIFNYNDAGDRNSVQ
jgi:hypothetical protein